MLSPVNACINVMCTLRLARPMNFPVSSTVRMCGCSDMMSQQEGASFFGRLLRGLLANLQPLAGPSGEPQHGPPLQSAAKDVFAAACQLLGADSFLQQVLQSVQGLGDAAKPINASQLEVG